MTQHIRKYHRAIAVLFTAFYLLGGFQLPLLECLHFATHMDDVLSGNFQNHNYNSHSDSHQHFALNLLDEVAEELPFEGIPADEKGDKPSNKSPQLIVWSPVANIFHSYQVRAGYPCYQFPAGNYISSIDPPPKI